MKMSRSCTARIPAHTHLARLGPGIARHRGETLRAANIQGRVKNFRTGKGFSLPGGKGTRAYRGGWGQGRRGFLGFLPRLQEALAVFSRQSRIFPYQARPMRLLCLSLLACLLYGLCPAQPHRPRRVQQVEVPTYLPPQGAGYIVLPLDYASPRLQHPEAWAGHDPAGVTAIDLVFTRYPLQLDRWRTDYDWLLDQRLRSLYALDSALFRQPGIRWRFILQTSSTSDDQARTRFHGFVLHYQPPPPVLPDSVLSWIDTIPTMRPLLRMILQGPLPDSGIYHALDRHPEWTGKLVVMDWTASMYPNGAAVLNWYRRHLATASLRHLVFFNDGDGTPHALKRPGRTGGIYHAQPEDLGSVLQLMDRVRRAGLGGDPAENDVEALIRASRSLRGDFETLILIPDRNTSIRDLSLLRHIGQPVRIVLFNNPDIETVGLGGRVRRPNYRIHPHYLTLAALTGGSIHTATEDLYDLHLVPAGGIFRYHDEAYERMENGAFRTKRDY